MADLPADVWLRCSACKRDLRFGSKYWECSVSTCNRNRMRLVFCSVACWDSHVADARHRDAWAVEARAPTKEEWAKVQADEVVVAPMPPPPGPSDAPAPRKVISAAPSPAPSSVPLKDGVEREILIVVSKMKKYIKDRSGMNTSDAVAEMLSDHVRAVCDEAIRNAGADNRKTVLDRDVPKPIRR
jgi:hypothetical protein